MPIKHPIVMVLFAAVLSSLLVRQGTAAPLACQENHKKERIKYIEVLGNYQWGLAKGSEHSTFETIGVGYQIHGPFFLQAEAGHCHFKLKDDDTRVQADGVIVNCLLRWHVLDSRYITLFAEAGIGVLSCNENIPSEGMETNTVPQAGIGLIIPVWHQARCVLGGRYMHVSHGLWKPHICNPGFNSAGLYAGLQFPF